ncbi:MAG: heme exporter protein CcmB, partial [Thiohalorhabdaceae bacterium]
MGQAFLAILKRDLTLSLRHRSEMANPLVFFLVVVSLFPLALGPEQETLTRVAPGILWVAALLAATLAMDGMFRADFEDGSLEQLLL